MKSTKVSAVTMNTAIVLALCAICIGCTPSTSPEDIGNPFLNEYFYWVVPGGYVSADDTVNTRAIIMLQQHRAELIDWPKNVDLTFTQHEARAFFHSMIPASEPSVDIFVNDTAINRARNWLAGGSDSVGFQTYFQEGAASNSLRKVADERLGAIDTAVSFGQAVRFSNVQRGDTIDLSEGKTFLLDGPSGNMELMIFLDEPSTDGSADALNKKFYGSGSATLTPDNLRSLKTGKGGIVVTRWESKFLPTSNGTKIAFVGRTSHMISVYIVK